MEIINSISNNRQFQKHGTKVGIVLGALLLIFALASAYMDFQDQKKIKTENYSPQPVTQRNNTIKQYNIRDIISANLFGNPAIKKPAKKAPKTTLDLTLQGILYTKESDVARAIVMVGRKKSGLYSVGEKIKGTNVSVKEIRDNEILLNRNGVTESLPLLKKTTSGDREIITFQNEFDNNFDETYDDHGSGEDFYPDEASLEEALEYEEEFENTTPPSAGNTRARQIKKPNFSGLDRALEKLGEL